MARNYTVQTKIFAPAADVFDAIVSREKLCHYFTDEASSDLVVGAEVKWRWKHYHATLPVVVNKVVPNELIELTINSRAWEKTAEEEYDVRVIFELESLGPQVLKGLQQSVDAYRVVRTGDKDTVPVTRIS